MTDELIDQDAAPEPDFGAWARGILEKLYGTHARKLEDKMRDAFRMGARKQRQRLAPRLAELEQRAEVAEALLASMVAAMPGAQGCCASAPIDPRRVVAAEVWWKVTERSRRNSSASQVLEGPRLSTNVCILPVLCPCR